MYGTLRQAQGENADLYKKRPVRVSVYINRHRAIFPGLDNPSIVTADRLNCCVRYGDRCFPIAMGTDFGVCADGLPTKQVCCTAIFWRIRLSV